jgi:hypothetical protein
MNVRTFLDLLTQFTSDPQFSHHETVDYDDSISASPEILRQHQPAAGGIRRSPQMMTMSDLPTDAVVITISEELSAAELAERQAREESDYVKQLRGRDTESYRQYKESAYQNKNLTQLVLASFEYAYEIFLNPELARQVDYNQIMSKLDDYSLRGINKDAGNEFIGCVFVELTNRLDEKDRSVSSAVINAMNAYFELDGDHHAGLKLCQYLGKEYARRIDLDERVIEENYADDNIDQILLLLNKHSKIEADMITDAILRQIERKNIAFMKIYTALHKSQDGSQPHFYADKKSLGVKELAAVIRGHAKQSPILSRTNKALELRDMFMYNAGCDENNIELINKMYQYVWEQSTSYTRAGLALFSGYFNNPADKLQTQQDVERKIQQRDKYVLILVDVMKSADTREAIFAKINNNQVVNKRS